MVFIFDKSCRAYWSVIKAEEDNDRDDAIEAYITEYRVIRQNLYALSDSGIPLTRIPTAMLIIDLFFEE